METLLSKNSITYSQDDIQKIVGKLQNNSRSFSESARVSSSSSRGSSLTKRSTTPLNSYGIESWINQLSDLSRVRTEKISLTLDDAIAIKERLISF